MSAADTAGAPQGTDRAGPADGPDGADGGRWCVIGAGPAGLTTAKNLRELGIAFDVVERREGLGGIWRYGEPGSSVYASTTMISSRRLIEFRGFPMARTGLPYPTHHEVLAYLRRYADHHDLARHIEYGRGATAVRRTADGWTVTFADGSRRRYRGVVVATGHHWDPKYPAYPGDFAGTVLHSAHYRTPEVFLGRRVLVVGGGNSGSDIAVEAARTAARTLHSTRHGCHYLPKFFCGLPTDEITGALERRRAPRWLQRAVRGAMSRLVFGDPARLALPRPAHRTGQGRTVLNSEIVHQVANGAVLPRPGVAELLGDRVRFTDGTVERVDVIVYATGFRTGVPVEGALSGARGPVPLHLRHPEHEDLFFVGHIQPSGGAWQLFDDQAAAVARIIAADRLGEAARTAVRRALERHARTGYVPPGPGGTRGDPLKVDLHRYGRVLARLRRDLDSVLTRTATGKAASS
ncbi:flavin-containing monooxygenase [Streptomyces sp. NPDC004111]|uniref:flavin-containing monooxygenase n=1 Tax=Streptomyces sp. NPDC004111 TaxID=3364690 RepID=UPI0036AB5CA8